ncbi:MAG: phosphonate metabolism protein/1,5-bisphosphokinase (PRPP-forming) PhnN, partial [Pseudomonadota bacterium]|nr:phosphonate metabolism protein/1,5-bisphosphokinase (PRPP-forming) PhnN [Pseudomonadota bacterium]
MSRGVLHLVVGPSGVGKDSLIDAARAARPDLVFPVRVITRPADAGGESHDFMPLADFERAETAGGFLLSWRAHGLAYGIPAEAGRALAQGRGVVVNVSRGVIGAARAAHAPIRVLAVTAPAAALARRLSARGRERAEQIAARLARAALSAPEGPDVHVIDNGAAFDAARAAFLAALAPAALPDRSPA